MKQIKKIFKILIILLAIFFIFVAIDLAKAKINSVDDISKLTKIKMYDTNKELFYEINNLHESTYVKLNDINENIQKTFIEIEDKRFYSHNGFDIFRIIKSLINNIMGESLMGGSTITQQYVKNIYLSNEQNIFRKIRELYYAIKIESIYSKNDILEGYLNTIYFNHGIYGIYDASKYYFDKEPCDISLAEAATLAAIIKSPTKYSPITNNGENTKRKELILNTLYQNKIIDYKEFVEAKNEKIKITKTRYNSHSNSVLFYKDIVLSEIEKTALKGQNIDIYTSFDISVNNFVDDYITANPIYSDLGIVILNNNGEIVSITSKNYSISSYNPAISGMRMIGSTIKPMLYYEALNYGLTPISKFTSQPTTFFINNNSYTFKNFNEQYNHSKITMAYALATSDNIYAVKTHLYIGSKKLISFLNKFDIKILDNYPSLALGTAEMSLLKLTSIYNTFSRLGVYSKPSTIRYINVNNKKLYINPKNDTQLLKANTSYIINDLLTYTFDINLGGNINVTGSSISNRLNTKVSAKTGLTDFDSYMVGHTPLYTLGIWTGNIDNSYHTDAISKNFPKQAFLHIMNNLTKENKNIWYEEPNDIYALFISPTDFNDNYLKKIYFKR